MFLIVLFVILVALGLHGGELTVNDVLLALILLVGANVMLRLLDAHRIAHYVPLLLVDSVLILKVFGHDIRIRPWDFPS